MEVQELIRLAIGCVGGWIRIVLTAKIAVLGVRATATFVD
jgi:hypothetical protein